MTDDTAVPSEPTDLELRAWGARITEAAATHGGDVDGAHARARAVQRNRLALCGLAGLVAVGVTAGAIAGRSSTPLELSSGGAGPTVGAVDAAAPVTTGPDNRPPCTSDASTTTFAPPAVGGAPTSVAPSTYPPAAPLPESPVTTGPPTTRQVAWGSLRPASFQQGPTSTVVPSSTTTTEPEPTTTYVLPPPTTGPDTPPHSSPSSSVPPDTSTTAMPRTDGSPTTGLETNTSTAATSDLVAPTTTEARPAASPVPTVPCQGGADTTKGFVPVEPGKVITSGELSIRRFSPESLGPLVGKEPNLHVMYRITRGEELVAVVTAHHAASNLVPSLRQPLAEVARTEAAESDVEAVPQTLQETRSGYLIDRGEAAPADQRVAVLLEISGGSRVSVTGPDVTSVLGAAKTLDLRALLGID